MLIRVFIRRPTKEGKDKETFALLSKLRSIAVNQEGHISSETLVGTDDPQEIMVVSTWQSMEDWNNWKESEDRKEIDDLLEDIQTEPTSYKSYAFRKFRISVKQGFPEPLD